MRVLVTGIGGPAGRSVCALLLQRGYKVIGADTERVDLIGLTSSGWPIFVARTESDRPAGH